MGNPGLKKATAAANNSERQKAVARRNIKRAQEENTTHGLSKHPLYRTWRGMLWRCSDKVKGTNRRVYFDRGIRVCERWLGQDGLKNFISDMGEKPDQRSSLDRINPDGNYEPGNCRWATFRQQIQNRGRIYGPLPRPAVVLRWQRGGPSFRQTRPAAC